jgi:subtilisin family serine protease
MNHAGDASRADGNCPPYAAGVLSLDVSPRRRAGAAALVATAPLFVAVTVSSANAAPPSTTGPAPGLAAESVTLITGDRVRLLRQPGGDTAVAIQPGPGREGIGFLREAHTEGGRSRISVTPSDAVPLVSAGRLDARLFDVTGLVRQRMTDAAPLIVEYAPGTGASAVPPAAATTVRALPSIRGAAVRPDRRRAGALWRWLTGGAGKTLPAGITRVSLDGIARPELDGSAAQVGAPAAHELGLTGRGITVGVLDTGVRADHPDLAGKVLEARDFTGTRPDASDDIGHGTHVAGIIAGTGVASAGRYRGVAPEATLVSGKVCVEYGCPESAVIAGMEWIAPKAPVVNLSLGGDSSDGTDPVSRALDALTAQYGTLFVAAAGNDRVLDGPADPLSSVVAPAAADTALAVGSVERDDSPSVFSPLGPRAGASAVKPDLAAPGAGIVSARAAGTPAGDATPVDENYAAMSGTSMSAPHVAAAAALLLQQHPQWTADRLRSTLTSTAAPTADVFTQGAGRLDVARAVAQPVTTAGAGVAFGTVTAPAERPVSRTVTYRNDGDAAVTLDLTVSAAGRDGAAAPAGLFRPAADRITVPAHGAAEVAVEVGASAGTAGLFAGRLAATADGVAVQTALAVLVEPRRHALTVRLVGRGGRLDYGAGQAVDVATGRVYGIRGFDATGAARVSLPPGRYDVNAIAVSTEPHHPDRPTAVTLMSRPGLRLVGDTAVVLDANAGRPVGSRVDRADAILQYGDMGIASADPAGVRTTSLSWTARADHRLFAAPTSRSVADHPYAFYLRETLSAADLAAQSTADVYHLALVERGRIPAALTPRVHDRELATVDARYHPQGGPALALRGDFARLPAPGANIGAGVFEFHPRPLPSRRIERYTAHPDVTWQQVFGLLAADDSDQEIVWAVRSYRPGRYRADWNGAPVGPAFGDPADGWGVFRAGDQLVVGLSPVSDSDPDHYVVPPDGLVGTTVLRRDGEVLGDSGLAGFGAFPLPDTPGRYTLRVTGTRTVPWSALDASVDVSWAFHEDGAGAAAPPRLFVVRASGELDDTGRASAGGPYRLALTVRTQPGAEPVRPAWLRVAVSTDDGATWRRIPATGAGEHWQATVDNPASGFVSLRVTAGDATGAAVTQTVVRAYAVS